MDALMTLGEAIKNRRESISLNQAELARLCGITPAAVCQIEKNQRLPNLKTLTSLLGVLDITFEELCEVKGKTFCPMCKREGLVMNGFATSYRNSKGKTK